MARRPNRINWSLMLLGVAVLAAGVVEGVVVAVTQTGIPVGRREQIVGMIIGVAFVPAVILVAKSFGMR